MKGKPPYTASSGGDLMISRISFPLASALFCAAAWAAQTTPLNVKTGEWESTSTNETTGQLPVPQEMLDKRKPDKPAKMEAAMKARGLQGPRPTVYKNCLKKEDLDKPLRKTMKRR